MGWWQRLTSEQPTFKLLGDRTGALGLATNRPCQTLFEDDGFVGVKKDAAFDVPADGSGEDDFFEVPALLYQVFQAVFVRDADHALLDDGAVVEDICDVMRVAPRIFTPRS